MTDVGDIVYAICIVRIAVIFLIEITDYGGCAPITLNVGNKGISTLLRHYYKYLRV